MKISFLGQAGLLFETNGVTVMIDPYFPDNVATVNPRNYRRVPVDERVFEIRPDVVIITHDHLDHLDPVTLPRFLGEDTHATVLAPTSSWQKLCTLCGGSDNNYILFDAGTSVTEFGITFRAVYAAHSDPNAIGVVLSIEGQHYYVTGDTLYNERVFQSLLGVAKDIPLKAVFLPINGVGNNMNVTDAARFVSRVNAEYAVPIHFGMFDELDPTTFDYPNRVIPRIYEEIKLE